ncbi:MAG: O-antigen ligase family protein [Myxococcota bacterium]
MSPEPPQPRGFAVLPPVLVLGGLALVWPVGEGLDRFTLPKEWVLLAGALACLPFTRRRPLTALSLFWWLAALGGVVSAAFAVHRFWGLRQAALTLGGAALFTACLHDEEASRQRLLAACGAFAALVALVAALESFGLFPGLSARGRAPGSLLGQRNHVAHLCALALPLLFLSALRTKRAARVAWAGAWTACAVVLVWTRSRTGWWGALAGFAALNVVLLRARRWRELGLLALSAAAVLVVASLAPVKLAWRGQHAYWRSLSTMADFEQGSGRGRWVQARNSLELWPAAPLVGVGPGNWVVHYPRVAAADETFDADAPFPTGRLMTNDVVSALVERGVWPLVAAGVVLFLARRRRFTAVEHHDAFAPTVATLAVVALGDSVLQLPAPQAWVAIALAAMTTPRASHGRGGGHLAPQAGSPKAATPVPPDTTTALELGSPPSPPADSPHIATGGPFPSGTPRGGRWRTGGLVVCAAVLAGALVFATGRLVSLTLRARGPTWVDAERALRFDPGDTVLRLELARSLALAGRCAEATPHFARAQEELPWHRVPECQ